MTNAIELRLSDLGIELPVAPAPLGAYVPAVTVGSLVVVSMQGPLRAGVPAFVGRVGVDVTVEQGRDAARLAILNVLAQLHRHLGGFDRLRRIVRLEGYVACADDFFAHPHVVDAASDFLASVFQTGHARSVCGVRNLPGNVPIALAVTAELAGPFRKTARATTEA